MLMMLMMIMITMMKKTKVFDSSQSLMEPSCRLRFRCRHQQAEARTLHRPACLMGGGGGGVERDEYEGEGVRSAKKCCCRRRCATQEGEEVVDWFGSLIW